MPGCVLRYCKNTTKNMSKCVGITFHRFLRPGQEKREAWILFVQRDRSESTWLPTEHSNICSAHFREEDFKLTKAGRKFLKKTAVPSNYSNPAIKPSSKTSSPSTSLADEPISDSDSIFDSPRRIELKKSLRKEIAAKQERIKEVRKLKRQNKNLRERNERLIECIKHLRDDVKNYVEDFFG